VAKPDSDVVITKHGFWPFNTYKVKFSMYGKSIVCKFTHYTHAKRFANYLVQSIDFESSAIVVNLTGKT